MAPAVASDAHDAAPAAFRRHNPQSDRFVCLGFDHVEFWCGDATTTWRRFALGLGMSCVAKSDQSTGNATYASYALRSNELVFVFTAPYGSAGGGGGDAPHPGYAQDEARAFFAAHGLGVRAVALRCADAAAAHAACVAGGAASLLPPTPLRDASGAACVMAEVSLYGDVALRLISRPEDAAAGSNDASMPQTDPALGCVPTPDVVLPGYARCADDYPRRCFGLRRLDHAVGNVPVLAAAKAAIAAATGFHEFAEFGAADVGTAESGLNSVVLANNSETVLLPVNEPTHGTKRRSQIQTYLEQHGGPGVQHLALKTDDIFATLRAMRSAGDGFGGFEFLRSADAAYYSRLPARLAGAPGALSAEQIAECEALGVLVDRDDQGVLLQIFTKPLGDRPTLFLEIIQRVGCRLKRRDEADAAWEREHGEEAVRADAGAYPQAGGCGGFGKGNFSELFRSVEAYEATLKA